MKPIERDDMTPAQQKFSDAIFGARKEVLTNSDEQDRLHDAIGDGSRLAVIDTTFWPNPGAGGGCWITQLMWYPGSKTEATERFEHDLARAAQDQLGEGPPPTN